MTQPSNRTTDNDPTLAVKLTLMAVSCLVTFGIGEGAVRLQNDSALPQLNIFTEVDYGVAFQSSASARVGGQGKDLFVVSTDTLGLRAAAAGDAPTGGCALVVGDSQPLGQGVDYEETFAARLTAAGVPTCNAGVPGYGVADALNSAEALLAPLDPETVVVVLNQANDWEDALEPITARYVVRGDWLVTLPEAETARGRFLQSPLSRSHLVFYLGWIVLKDWSPKERPAPDWMTAPAGQAGTTAAMVGAVDAFAARHPERRVLTVYLPVDVAASETRADDSPFGGWAAAHKPWTDTVLRDQVMAARPATVDLLPTLKGCDACFLDRDYHLSAEGHARVADALKPALSE